MDLFILVLFTCLIISSGADKIVANRADKIVANRPDKIVANRPDKIIANQAAVESKQQQSLLENYPSLGGGYITTYDPAKGPYIQEYQNIDLDSILGPKIDLSRVIDKGYDYTIVDDSPQYGYNLEGRQGIGFDKRTAYALGMRYPLTPQLLETNVRPKGSQLKSEQES